MIFPGVHLLADSDVDGACDEFTKRRWWAVYTKARQEKSLAKHLIGHAVPFYLPLIAHDNMVRGRRVQSQIPLFTGYLFLYGSNDERVTCLTTNRVSRILPVTEQQELARDLRQVQRLIELDVPLTIERRLVPGRRVKIKSGPMQGVEGKVIARRAKTRLLVAVNFLQQGASIEIEDFQVEPLS
ncbi:MAG: antitermination protein NusG [Planctomycetia bacterium]|nr:antitermination protein NusG [Planctomycetia bacterium]